MKYHWAIGLAGVMAMGLAAGCSSHANAISADLAASPVGQALMAANPEGTRTKGEAGERGKRGRHGRHGDGMKKMMESGCATKTGDHESGGTMTFANCATPNGGTINGTTTWSGDQDPGEAFRSTTTKDLTITRGTSEESGRIPELGHIRRMLGEEFNVSEVAWDQSRIASNMTSSGTKGDRESFRRTGTTTITLSNGGATVRTIAITWNGERTVTVDIDGQSQTVNLEERMREFREKRGERGKRQHEATAPATGETVAL